MGAKGEQGERVCVGVVTGTKGIRGDVRVKSFTADPRNLGNYGPLSDKSGTTVFRVTVTGVARGQVIARFGGIEDRTAAERLKGTELYIAKAALPETGDDEFYFSDLVGLRVEGQDGSDFGTITNVGNFGAGDVLEISGSGSGEIMVPFTKRSVPLIDLDGARVVIVPPDELP